MNENLAHNLTTSAHRDPNGPALRIEDAVITYAELDEATARVAGLLRERGLEPGDRVGVMLPNVPQFAFAYYGVLRAGGVVVPMNILLKQREVEFYLGDSEACLGDPNVDQRLDLEAVSPLWPVTVAGRGGRRFEAKHGCVLSPEDVVAIAEI